MTEALKKDWQKTCAERIDEQWELRREDLKDPEFEGLGFDYVEPHTFTDQLEGYWRWQFSWGGPSDELRAFVNENRRSIAWNTGSWTGWTVLSWSCSQGLRVANRMAEDARDD